MASLRKSRGKDSCSPKNGQEEDEKRNIPLFVQRLLAWDVQLTKQFCYQVSRTVPLEDLRSQAFALEIMCNGFLWIPGSLAAIWLVETKSFLVAMTNLLLALLLDVAIIAVIKAFTRRRRPPNQNPGMIGQVGPDKFSFPSGHASRAFLIALLFTYVHPIWAWPRVSGILFAFITLMWASAVSVSRVLYGRHYLFDVMAGIAIGVVQSKLWTYLWLDNESAVYFLSWFTSMEDYF